MSVMGYAQGATIEPLGSELVADVAAGSLVLPLEWTGQFDDAAGALDLNGQVYTYSAGAIDEDAATITLDSVTLAAATTGDAVTAASGTAIISDLVLHVSCGDGDDIEVVVPFRDRDLWPEGEYDDPVQVLLSDDLETIVDVPGRRPVRDLSDNPTIETINTDLSDAFAAADAAAAAAAAAEATGTAAQTTANGKNKVTYSAAGPGVTPNTAGDIWFQRSGGLIYGQWEGLGGTSWEGKTLAGSVIAYLDAGQLTAGSAFINGLHVLTNFTLGDASTNGVIQSYNFATETVGVYIDKFGLVAKGGQLTGTTVLGGTVTGATVQTASSGERVVIRNDGSGGIIEFFSGVASEVAGYLNPTMASGQPALTMRPGSSTYYDLIPSLAMQTGSSGAAINSAVSIAAAAIGLTATDGITCSGNVHVTGTTHSIGAISSDAGISADGGISCLGGIYTFDSMTAEGYAFASRFRMTATATSAAAANAYIDGDGTIWKSTSSLRYKDVVGPTNLDPATVLALDDIAFTQKGDDSGRVRFGAAAEQAHELGLEAFVDYDAEGRPDGFGYGPFAAVGHQVVLRDHEKRIADLEATVQRLLDHIEGA